MPRGACVVEYVGKRGRVFRLKYADADGRQVMETLGPERQGWTRRKAEAELRERLVRVDRKGYRKPGPLTFGEYADTWEAQGRKRRNWKPATVERYGHVLAHLRRAFGTFPLAGIRPRHVAVYVSDASSRLGANTVNLHLAVLHDVFESALREELVDTNPARRAERPKRPRRKWRIITPAETQATLRGYTELEEAEQDDRDREYLTVHRVAFLTLILTTLRQHELRDLRWRSVDLIDNVLRVADAKSEEGERSIAIPPTLAEELWQHRRRTRFQGNAERVFCDPKTGGPYGIKRHREALAKALRRAGVAEYVRPFHDLRHSAITHDAASGASAIAVMTKAGHRNMATTKTYLHLAGVVFRDEAERLERRLLGGVESSTHLSEPERPHLT